MLLLLQHEDHISSVRIRVLVCHFPEGDLVAIWRALLHVHLQHLPLLLRLEALALTSTRVALRLHLLNHGPHAHDLDLHAAAVAFPTLLDALLLVDDLASDGHLLRGANIHLLQCDLEVLNHILGLLAPSLSTSTPAAASPEEGFEDVSCIARPVVVQAFLTKTIVLRTLVGITENLVGSGDLLELLRVAALVRVMLHGQLSVCLLDVGL
mmetsp:Transcript_29749/g.41756  ORF Transcript_29749/g.41756 Transcript_29749/m.41756 type:complete len:210 (-) Transcript_29749:214-843(-)